MTASVSVYLGKEANYEEVKTVLQEFGCPIKQVRKDHYGSLYLDLYHEQIVEHKEVAGVKYYYLDSARTSFIRMTNNMVSSTAKFYQQDRERMSIEFISGMCLGEGTETKVEIHNAAAAIVARVNDFRC